MKDPHYIVERPLLTEKSTDLSGLNKFIFKVRSDSNKIEIAKAIELIYARDGIKVLAVNTISVKGKKRRAQTKGAKSGYTPNWKKAVVTTDKPLSVYEELGV